MVGRPGEAPAPGSCCTAVTRRRPGRDAGTGHLCTSLGVWSSLGHHQVPAEQDVVGAVRDRQVSPRRLYVAKAAKAAVERDRAADISGYAEQQARHVAGLDGHAILMLLKGWQPLRSQNRRE